MTDAPAPRPPTSFPPIPDDPRPIAARGPGTGAEALRLAYLDLLKLALCDLVGATTHMVWHHEDGRVFSRELPDDEQRRWRVDGTDWPLNGLTMVGLRRLDDLQRCVEDVIANGVPGDLIEAGAWRGGASIMTRATLDTLGATDRTLYVADSFQGFPAPEPGTEDQHLDQDMSAIDYLAPRLEDVKGYFARFGCERGVEFVPGFFEETMDGLAGRRWSLIRLDADSYNATRLALQTLYPGLAVGGYVVIDDYFHIHLDVCRRAVDDFRHEHGITEEIVRLDSTGARWRRQTPAAQTTRRGDAQGAAVRAPLRAAAQRTGRPIPTDREQLLEGELEKLRERIRELEAELEAARRPPRVIRTRRR